MKDREYNALKVININLPATKAHNISNIQYNHAYSPEISSLLHSLTLASLSTTALTHTYQLRIGAGYNLLYCSEVCSS